MSEGVKATAFVVSAGLTAELDKLVSDSIATATRGLARPREAVPTLRMVHANLETMKSILSTKGSSIADEA